MAVQNELGFHTLMCKDIYGILLKKTNNIYDMTLFCKKADPSSSQFHVYIERQGYEGIHYSAFHWKEDLGLEWEKGWLNEHTFYFIYFSIV